MFGRRRRRGMGLSGFIVIIGLLWFTGAGAWLWERTLQLESQCYTMLVQMGSNVGSPICAGMGKAITGIDRFFSGIGDSVTGAVDSVLGTFSGTPRVESMFGDLQVSNSLARLGSGKDELLSRLNQGPQALAGGSNAAEQLRNALDSFSIGQRFMGGDGSSSYQALPWLQQGAQTPGYGVLSQLSLGELYRTGNGGVSANPQAATQYYSQAYQSIALLRETNTPEAQQMLKALPASPGKMQEEILATIRTLKAQR